MSFSVRCSCGELIAVQAGQAGTETRCGCGRTCLVPSLRELQESLAATGSGSVRPQPVVRGDKPWQAARPRHDFPEETLAGVCGSATTGRIEYSNSSSNATFGVISCAIGLVAIGSVLFMGISKGGLQTPGDYGLAAVLLLVLAAAAFGLVTYIRRLGDSSVQLALDREGISGCRTQRGLIRWVDIRKARPSLQRIGASVSTAFLILTLGSDDSVTEGLVMDDLVMIDLAGLDQAPKMIFESVKRFRGAAVK